jgi:hypothetical protein
MRAGENLFMIRLGQYSILLRRGGVEPSSISFEEAIKSCNSKVIEDLWQKIHTRRGVDPEGAITASRSLIESVIPPKIRRG